MEEVVDRTIAGWIASEEEEVSRLKKRLPGLKQRNAKAHASTLAAIAKFHTTDPDDPVALCKALLEVRKAAAEQSRPAHDLKSAMEGLERLRMSREGLEVELRRRDEAAKSVTSAQ